MAELKKIDINGDTQPKSKQTSESKKPTSTQSSFPWAKGLIIILTISAGIGTGYTLHYFLNQGGSSQKTQINTTASPDKIKPGDIFGVKDAADIFPDQTTGVLVKGGIDGEGSHHLLRAPDESKNVYLTSTVLDLDQFVGHKIQVRGQTNDASKAGWLMDVGKVKIVQLNAEKPF